MPLITEENIMGEFKTIDDYEEQMMEVKFKLRTVLIEIEALINARPLTYINSDTDGISPLAPSIIIGNDSSVCLPLVSNYEIKNFKSENEDIIKLWKKRESVKKKFWNRWKTEYLHQLRSANLSKQGKSNYLKENDVVLVQKENQQRLMWQMGIVKKVFPGRDNKIRSCEIKLVTGNVIKRPIQRIYPLEI